MNSWIPDVNSGSCTQEQEDGSWQYCSCPPGASCGFDGGAQHVTPSPMTLLESLTPEGAKEFADRWLIGESGTSDPIAHEVAQHIYRLLALLTECENELQWYQDRDCDSVGPE